MLQQKQWKTLQDFAFWDNEKIKAYQEKAFLKHLEYLASNSPFYKNLFKQEGILWQEIKGLDDLYKLPFTQKKDLNEHNVDFLAAPEKNIVDVCLTSATSSGVPTRLLQTKNDLQRLAFNEEISFAMCGLQNTDILYECAAIDRCFMAGLAYFMGAVELGVQTVRAGSSSAAVIWETMQYIKPTALVGVPSLLRKTAEIALNQGKNPAEIGVKKIIAIGETIRGEDMELLDFASKLEELWQAEIYSTYASTELATSFCECQARQGGHLRQELIITEIIDEKGNPLPPGEKGEVVVTPLSVTGMPLLRYKTNDISFIIDSPCSCGRNPPRLGPVLGRKNQMLKYKGTTIFPGTLISIVEGCPGFYTAYVQAEKGPAGEDQVRLFVAKSSERASLEDLKHSLRSRARVLPQIEIITEPEMDKQIFLPGKRKKVQFVDKRGE